MFYLISYGSYNFHNSFCNTVSDVFSIIIVNKTCLLQLKYFTNILIFVSAKTTIFFYVMKKCFVIPTSEF